LKTSIFNRIFPAIAIITPVVLTCPLTAGEEIQTYSLPNGLEVRARHLANTGIVHARLVFSWIEGTEYAPVGAAWMMSKVLPVLGSGGMDNATFQSHKDQAGVISRIDVGRGWIAWNFNSLPADADMMIQFLVDEALRPSWTKSEQLPKALAKANSDYLFYDTQGDPVQSFKNNIGDISVPQPPVASIDRRQFVAMWASVIRRPERAVLNVTGDIESISLKRMINQHFGPWEGVRPGRVAPVPIKTTKTEWPKRTVHRSFGISEVWVGWNLDVLTSAEILPATELIPWLLRAVMPTSDEVINTWETDPGGRWIRAIGQTGVSPDKLESHLKSALNLSITQDLLDKALKARDEYIRANVLYPHRALEQDALACGFENTDPLMLDTVQQIIKKCMEPDNLTVLVLGTI